MLPIARYLAGLTFEKTLWISRHERVDLEKAQLAQIIRFLQSDPRISIFARDGLYIVYNKQPTHSRTRYKFDASAFNGLIFDSTGELLAIPPRAFTYLNYEPAKLIKSKLFEDSTAYIARNGTMFTYYFDDGWRMSTMRGLRMEKQTMHGKIPLHELVTQVAGVDLTTFFHPDFCYTLRISHPDWNPGVDVSEVVFIQSVDLNTFEVRRDFAPVIKTDEVIEVSDISTLLQDTSPNFAGVILRSTRLTVPDYFIEGEKMSILRRFVYNKIKEFGTLQHIALNYAVSRAQTEGVKAACPEIGRMISDFESKLETLVSDVQASLQADKPPSPYNRVVNYLAKEVRKHFSNPNTARANISDVVYDADMYAAYDSLWIGAKK